MFGRNYECKFLLIESFFQLAVQRFTHKFIPIALELRVGLNLKIFLNPGFHRCNEFDL